MFVTENLLPFSSLRISDEALFSCVLLHNNIKYNTILSQETLIKYKKVNRKTKKIKYNDTRLEIIVTYTR